ncbi:MAG: hypothetical protein ABIL39_10650 [candidate division WOR-3 bacterium]
MNKEELKQKMEKVAEILGYQFLIKEEFAYFVCSLKKDNCEIMITQHDYPPSDKEKIIVSSSYPKSEFCRYYLKPEDIIQIKISEKKSPEQIANDIKRRFLPPYLIKLEKITKEIEKLDNYYKEKFNALNKIANRFGWKVVNGQIDFDYKNHREIDKIEEYDDKKVRISFVIEPEMAIKFLEILFKTKTAPMDCNINLQP